MAHSSITLEEVSSLSVASAATTSTCVGTLYQRYATTDWSLPLFFSKSTQEIKVSTGRVGVNIGQSHTSSDVVMLVKTNLRPLSDRKVWADEHICGIFVKLLLLLHPLSRFFSNDDCVLSGNSEIPRRIGSTDNSGCSGRCTPVHQVW